MRNKVVLGLSLSLIILFIIGASYFWFIYFLDFHSNGSYSHNSNTQGKILLTKESDKIIIKSDISNYHFKVTNYKTGSAYYSLYIEDIPNSEVNDGCNENTLLKRRELDYQLKLNGKIVKTGSLGSIVNNILDKQFINIDVANDYELRIWINSNSVNYEGKHYHYRVILEEEK